MTEGASAAGLEVERLRVTRGGFRAGPFTFRAERGRVTSITGPNGCGKSTLLGSIAGLLPAVDGGVRFAGEGWSEKERTLVPPHQRSIGLLPQGLGLWPHLSVREQARLVGGGAEAIVEMAEALDLSGLLDRRPASLSGGEAQRAALLRAVAPRPALLLLDEPTGQQFPGTAARVREVIEGIAATGSTVLVVTHRAWPGASAVELFRRGGEPSGGAD
jgi:ABC-type sugar transport system ATPase subunit